MTHMRDLTTAMAIAIGACALIAAASIALSFLLPDQPDVFRALAGFN